MAEANATELHAGPCSPKIANERPQVLYPRIIAVRIVQRAGNEYRPNVFRNVFIFGYMPMFALRRVVNHIMHVHINSERWIVVLPCNLEYTTENLTKAASLLKGVRVGRVCLKDKHLYCFRAAFGQVCT
ncbi:hypothetical protein KC340_g111 [Hortaea werneckii]|nr:hypothetical protein KC340_g111 [Hortaea werneckii]